VAWAVRRVGRRSASTQLRKHHQRRQTLEQPPHFSAGESGSSRLAGRLAQLPRRPTALERELHAAQNAEQLTLRDSAFMASPIERDSVKPSTRLPVGSLNALDPAGLGKTFDYHALTGETQRELPFTGPPSEDDEEMKDSDSHSVWPHSTSLRSSRHSHASGGGVGSFFAAGVVPAGVLGGDSDSDWGSDGGDEERPPLNYAELLKHQARRNAHASSTAPAPTAAAAAVAWRESAARHPLTSSAVRSPARLPGRASVVAPRLLAEDRGAAATAGIEAEVGPMATLDEDGSAEAGSTAHALNVPVGLLSSASNAFAGLDSPLDAAVASSAAARRPSRLASRLAAAQLDEQGRGRRESHAKAGAGSRPQAASFAAPAAPPPPPPIEASAPAPPLPTPAALSVRRASTARIGGRPPPPPPPPKLSPDSFLALAGLPPALRSQVNTTESTLPYFIFEFYFDLKKVISKYVACIHSFYPLTFLALSLFFK
jgi:hypothetical protein